ncbi:MAG: hypothetical protein WC841_04595 [Candidatus Shapirobacteria bacterium]
MATRYSAENFRHTTVIIGNRPYCDKLSKPCHQAIPQRAFFLSEYNFQVTSCTECLTPRQNQPNADLVVS